MFIKHTSISLVEIRMPMRSPTCMRTCKRVSIFHNLTPSDCSNSILTEKIIYNFALDIFLKVFIRKNVEE